MLLYRTTEGPVVEDPDARRRAFVALDSFGGAGWDGLLASADLQETLRRAIAEGRPAPPSVPLLSPVGSQEVWAAGVTYFRSRSARMDESKAAGGGSFYDRVYEAERPELFLKATPLRVVPPHGTLRLRKDSRWIVPEPELTLVVDPRGQIIGYTIGNDLSCRDIEGENPLYLPQAKTFDGCASVGPAIFVTPEPLPATTEIALSIRRAGEEVSSGTTTLAQLKRSPAALVEFLYRETTFPVGCFLMTGTGIVPEDGFTLQPGDEIRITIAPMGTLVNTVA